MKVSTKWTKHIADPEKRDSFVKALGASSLGFGRLSDLIRERQNEIDSTEFRVSDFEDPSWSHKQAFRNGQKAMMKEILDLINFK